MSTGYQKEGQTDTDRLFSLVIKTKVVHKTESALNYFGFFLKIVPKISLGRT